MSDSVSSTSGAASTGATGAASAAAGKASGTAGSFDTNTKISSVGDLKEKAPKVYDSMMEGIATTIIGRMRKSQERLKQMWREGRERG